MTDPAGTRELETLRRYLGTSGPNRDSYRADSLTLSPVPGSCVPRVTLTQAVAALDAIALKLRQSGAHD